MGQLRTKSLKFLKISGPIQTLVLDINEEKEIFRLIPFPVLPPQTNATNVTRKTAATKWLQKCTVKREA